MRALALAVLALSVGIVGCLEGGEPISPDDEAVEPTAADANETPTDANTTSDRRAANATDAPANRTTAHQNTTKETEANTTEGPEADDQPPALPGNLSMEGGEIVQRSDRRVTFRWNGTTEQPPTEDPLAVASADFDVPGGIPLHVNASLTWDGRLTPALFVEGDGVRSYCAAFSNVVPSADETPTCEVRTMARSHSDRWAVTLKSRAPVAAPSGVSGSFSVTLSLEVAEAWEGPPFEAPGPGPGAARDPGWPSLPDAEIRPGTKVGASDPFNAGTANFVFSGPDNRTLYLGWIAHGVVGMEPGDTVTLPEAGVEAELVYCSWGAIEETVTCPYLSFAWDQNNLYEEEITHPEAFNDFALLRIPAEARSLVHPATLGWGGPTGLAGEASPGDRLLALGNTPFRDAGRVGVNPADLMVGVASGSHEWSTQAHLAPQPIPGDSGSPVLTVDGRAQGTISAIGPPGVRGPPSEPQPRASAGTTVVPNVGKALGYLENETALEVELETWPLFDRPRAGDLVGAPTSP